eukprot:1157712-Pelagomonas_calceolata.AAC.9
MHHHSLSSAPPQPFKCTTTAFQVHHHSLSSTPPQPFKCNTTTFQGTNAAFHVHLEVHTNNICGEQSALPIGNQRGRIGPRFWEAEE